MPDLGGADKVEPLSTAAPQLLSLSLAGSPLSGSDIAHLQCLDALTELQVHCPSLGQLPLARWPGLAQLGTLRRLATSAALDGQDLGLLGERCAAAAGGALPTA